MKTKLLLAFLVVAGLIATAQAQTISVGPRVGVTFAQIHASGDNADELNDAAESNTGFQVGAVSNIMLSELFSIQPELLFIQKGAKVGDSDYFKLRTDYLELPILAKVSFGPEQLKGFVTAGPTVGYWLSAKSISEIGGNKESESYDFEDEDNRLEIGASFGVGVAYKVGAGELNLDVRYGLGFSSIAEYEGDYKEKNQVFGVSLAYLFSL
ncbi:porin family protein [uncultured Pontibacter sp.]|uniref:porin family protein n=1 Tax=uncultured Pontibacter sp. TaxID=453356 RepID=UPI00260D1E8E|nr:porin family protein [uncultured Pontibacter sp.]